MKLVNKKIIIVSFTAFMFCITVVNADPLKVASLDKVPAFDFSASNNTNPLEVAPVKIAPGFGLSARRNDGPISTACVDEKLASRIADEQLDDSWVDVDSEQFNLAPSWVDVDPAWVDVNPASSISENTSSFNNAWGMVDTPSSISDTNAGPLNNACVDIKHSIASGVAESDILNNLVSAGYDMDLDTAVQTILDASGNQQNTLIAALIVNPDYGFTPSFDPTAGFDPSAAGGPKAPILLAKATDNSAGGGKGVSP